MMFVQQAAEPSQALLTKRWSVTLDLLAAQASQIHEPLGSVLKCGFIILYCVSMALWSPQLRSAWCCGMYHALSWRAEASGVLETRNRISGFGC